MLAVERIGAANERSPACTGSYVRMRDRRPSSNHPTRHDRFISRSKPRKSPAVRLQPLAPQIRQQSRFLPGSDFRILVTRPDGRLELSSRRAEFDVVLVRC